MPFHTDLVLVTGLLACLATAPRLTAAPQEDFDFLNRTAEVAAEEEGYLQLAVQRGETPQDHEALIPELYAGLSPEWQARADQFRRDPLISDLVRRVALSSPDQPRPVLVVLSHTVQGAHFNRSFVVVGTASLAQDAEAKDVAVARRNTLLHELGHFLQFRLHGRWLPHVDYRSTEFVGTDSRSHQFDKVTNAATAWVEGFAEATAAFLGSDDRLEEFSHRKVLYLGIADRPRDPEQLERIEGWVAAALHDFWLPKRSTQAFQRTQDAMRQRHESFRAYLREHLTLYPSDALRWEAVLRANTLLASSAINGVSLPADVHGQIEAYGAGLRRLGRSLGAPCVARAIWLALLDGGDGAPSLDRVEALARQLSAAGSPLFVTPDSGGEKYESMPLEALRDEVLRARQTYRDQMQTIGYDAHPRVKECKERWSNLQALYARRGGR